PRQILSFWAQDGGMPLYWQSSISCRTGPRCQGNGMPEGVREKPAPRHREKPTPTTASDALESAVSEPAIQVLGGRAAPSDGSARAADDKPANALAMAPDPRSRSRLTLRLQRTLG